jgi:transcriptional antiterminator Rof (Rho-off)
LNNLNESYKAVDCSFHDLIEAAIVMRTVGNISYLDLEGKQTHCEGIKVVDWINKRKEEFVVLSNGIEIRMDRISSFMGKAVINGSCAI